MEQGFITLHRKLIDWEWYDDLTVFKVFIHCLLKANHKDKDWRGIAIKRGQFITSFEKLAIETNMSIQQARTAIEKLVKTGEINKQATNRYTLITLVNYTLYQSQQQAEQQTNNKQTTNKQQTNNKQITTTNNDNNDNNDNNENNILLKKESKEKKFSSKDFKKFFIDAGADNQHIDDWLKVRKTKKASNTKTTLQQIINECQRNNFDLKRVPEICATNSWSGFKVDWIKNLKQNTNERTGQRINATSDLQRGSNLVNSRRKDFF